MKFRFLDPVAIDLEFYRTPSTPLHIIGFKYEERKFYYRIGVIGGPPSADALISKEWFREEDLKEPKI